MLQLKKSSKKLISNYGLIKEGTDRWKVWAKRKRFIQDKTMKT
jgi:hypothetical protein